MLLFFLAKYYLRNYLTPTDGIYILIHNKTIPPDLDSKIIKVHLHNTFMHAFSSLGCITDLQYCKLCKEQSAKNTCINVCGNLALSLHHRVLKTWA